jgi:hypothetical protein
MNPTQPQMPAPAPTPPPTNSDPSQFGNYSQWAQQEMAKGFTPDQLHQTLQTSGASNGGGAGGGNWFTHLLPTIGGVVGGIGGGLLTAGLGGEVAGGAGGSALGKALENSLEGKKVIQGNDLTAGAEGTIGSGVGGVASKVIGKGASLLGNTAENMIAKDATQTASKDAIDTAANTYKDVNPKLQANLGAKDSIEHVTNMGYDPSPANLTHVSNTSNDILNDSLNKALADAGPVDTSNYTQMVKDALAKEGGTLGSFMPTALARGRLGPANTPAAKLLTQLENLGQGVAKTNSDPNEIRTLTTKLGQLAEDARPTPTAATGAIDPAQRSAYNAISDVRNQLKDALYNRPEINDAITKMEGNILPDEGMNITPQLADHLNGIISGAGKNGGTGAQDLLSAISNNINVGKLGQEGQKVGQIVTSTGAQARAAAEAGLPTGATTASGNPVLDTAANFMGGPHAGILTTAVKGAVHAAQNPAILSTLSRFGALGSKLAPAAATAVATSPNLAADPTGQPGTANGTMGVTMNNTNGMTAGGTVDPTSLQGILAQYMHMGTVDPYLLSSTSPVIQALAPQVQKQQLLGSELNTLPSSYANAGGAQGLGGILSHVTGLVPGTAANTYEHQSQAVAQQLAATLGISPQAAMSLVPSLMQNGQSAGLTSGILGSMQGQLAQ